MNKYLKTSLFFVLLSTFFTKNIIGQETLFVQKKAKEYLRSVREKDHLKMLELTSLIPALQLDIKYTTTNNFTKQILYPYTKTTFARKELADILISAQKEFLEKGFALKVFDAYRPYSVTKKMWEVVPDERYAANPAKGSGHNRGAAIDLTLVDVKTLKELDMGTGFDNFTDTAHISFKNLPEQVLANRNLLATVLTKHGLVQLSTEWWHFYLPDSKRFPLMDFSFGKMKKLSKKTN